MIINVLCSDRCGMLLLLVFPVICAIFPADFYKNPLVLDSHSLVFTLQMQGEIVKNSGIFSENGRESQAKRVGRLSSA